MFTSLNKLYLELKKEIGTGLFSLTLITCLSLVFIRFRKDLISQKSVGGVLEFFFSEKNQMTAFPEWANLMMWAIFSIIGYVCFPLLYLWIVKPAHRTLGLGKISPQHYSLYLILAVLMLSLVYLFSFQPAFQNTYPFYRYSDGGRFWWQGFSWEFIYVLQFVALEFFFRGFLIHQSAPYLGKMSIYFSMIPYCMIHFSKPLPECLGSIFAGYILGWLSYSTKSIWGGVFLHISVALSMDILSTFHRHF